MIGPCAKAVGTLREFLRFYAMGRLYGIPRCCTLQWCGERALGVRPSPRRLQYGGVTQGRVPCSLHAALLGEPSPAQKAALARRARAVRERGDA